MKFRYSESKNVQLLHKIGGVCFYLAKSIFTSFHILQTHADEDHCGHFKSSHLVWNLNKVEMPPHKVKLFGRNKCLLMTEKTSQIQQMTTYCIPVVWCFSLSLICWPSLYHWTAFISSGKPRLSAWHSSCFVEPTTGTSLSFVSWSLLEIVTENKRGNSSLITFWCFSLSGTVTGTAMGNNSPSSRPGLGKRWMFFPLCITQPICLRSCSMWM